eukprot:scaffold30_cov416-Prasinococcus_capsulatus_cf.AAC.42
MVLVGRLRMMRSGTMIRPIERLKFVSDTNLDSLIPEITHLPCGAASPLAPCYADMQCSTSRSASTAQRGTSQPPASLKTHE